MVMRPVVEKKVAKRPPRCLTSPEGGVPLGVSSGALPTMVVQPANLVRNRLAVAIICNRTVLC